MKHLQLKELVFTDIIVSSQFRALSGTAATSHIVPPVHLLAVSDWCITSHPSNGEIKRIINYNMT